MAINHSFYKDCRWDKINSNLPAEMLEYLEEEVSYYKKNIPAGRILDVGCGEGRILSRLDNHITHGHGIDINETSVQLCKENLPKNKYKVGSITETGYPDSYFDCIVLSFNLLGNLDNDKDLAIREIRRILKPGGMVLFSTYSQRSEKIQESAYRSLPGFSKVSSKGDYTFAQTEHGPFSSERFDEDKLRKLFSGFSLELTEDRFTYLGKATPNPKPL